MQTLQVGLIMELLEHLPERGCKYCVEADPPEAIGVNRKCCCDDLFLKPVGPLKWRPTDSKWFDRQRRGESWYKNLVARISSKAETSKVYTNSSYRPSGITGLASAEYSNKEIMMFTGQKSSEVVERYKKQANRLTPEQVREAGMLLCPSGRQALRGGENYFGEIEGGGEEDNVGRVHRELIQKKREVCFIFF